MSSFPLVSDLIYFSDNVAHRMIWHMLYNKHYVYKAQNSSILLSIKKKKKNEMAGQPEMV